MAIGYGPESSAETLERAVVLACLRHVEAAEDAERDRMLPLLRSNDDGKGR